MKSLFMVTIILFATCLTFPLNESKKMTKDEQATNLLLELSPADAPAPGIQYIAVNKDTVIFSFSSGFADIENKIPLTINHTLSAFSMTKTITAIAILQLAEKQKLDLDDKLSKFIENPYNEEISIRQLLNHTSGIPNPIPLKWVHLASDHKNFIESELLNKVLTENSKLKSNPGEKYSYSNIGYWLLGKVIEKVSEQDYGNYVRENIFRPLHLSSQQIDFVIADSSNHAKGYLGKYSFMNLIKGFVTDKKVWGEYEGNWLHIKDLYVNGPSFGGAIGSAKAFAGILQDLLSEHSSLLNEYSKRLLYTRQKIQSGKYIDMTPGWHIGNLEEFQYFYKEGGGAGFHCEMRIYPTISLASVIMTNKTLFNTRKHLSRIDKIFLDESNNKIGSDAP